ncbi:hypothetical protein [Mycobacterium sp. 852002-51971_SCH5477799-a]|uniref:hypothetical protein n=1 Tax=Mycobacterium sp. 852002-51971_SCH5477799-a TaxID=1834106 RepID=UPI001E64F2A1|nr:hypothetical protein [Mycobacterium sp. 852002-51971_SCH5477799-a]
MSISLKCDDCKIVFKANDYAVHVRNDTNRWAIDMVDDRGNRRNDTATFSCFDLVEKYLVWDWATLARSGLASGPLGTDLYKLGYAAGVDVLELDKGNVELCLADECATLVVGDATIFSHIMLKSLDDLLGIARQGGL